MSFSVSPATSLLRSCGHCMSTLRLCTAMQRRSSHVKSVRRSSTLWLTSVNTWLVSVGLSPPSSYCAASLISSHQHTAFISIKHNNNNKQYFQFLLNFKLLHLIVLLESLILPDQVHADVSISFSSLSLFDPSLPPQTQLTLRTCRLPVRHVGSRLNAACL